MHFPEELTIKSIGSSIKEDVEEKKPEKKEIKQKPQSDEVFIKTGKDGKAECEISEADLKKYMDERKDKSEPLHLKADCDKKKDGDKK